LEVKAWPGKTIFYGDCAERIHNNGKPFLKRGHDDPRKQVVDNVSDLKSYLGRQGFAGLPIARAVVIVGGETEIKDAGGVFIVRNIGELRTFINMPMILTWRKVYIRS